MVFENRLLYYILRVDRRTLEICQKHSLLKYIWQRSTINEQHAYKGDGLIDYVSTAISSWPNSSETCPLYLPLDVVLQYLSRSDGPLSSSGGTIVTLVHNSNTVTTEKDNGFYRSIPSILLL